MVWFCTSNALSEEERKGGNVLYGVKHTVKDHLVTEETCCCHYMDNFFRLAANVLVLSNGQDNTYHGLWYISQGTLAAVRNSSVGPPWGIDPMTHCTMSRYCIMELYSSSLYLMRSCSYFVTKYYMQQCIIDTQLFCQHKNLNFTDKVWHFYFI